MADLAQLLLATAAEHGGRVAAHEHPRQLWPVDALPEGSTGGILGRAVEVPVEVVQ